MFAAALTYQTAWRWFVLQAKPAKNIPLAKAKPSKSGRVGLIKKLNLCRFDWSFHPRGFSFCAKQPDFRSSHSTRCLRECRLGKLD